MERRTFFGAFSAALAALSDWLHLTHPQIACVPTESLCGCSPQQRCDDQSGCWDKPDLMQLKLVVVQGGTIPNAQPDGTVVIQPIGTPAGHTGSAWYKQYVPTRAGCYPRENMFAVDQEILVGTVDELVADYREKLVQAAKRFYDPQAMLYQVAMAQAQILQDKYGDLGCAVRLPRAYDTHPRIASQARIKRALDAGIRPS